VALRPEIPDEAYLVVQQWDVWQASALYDSDSGEVPPDEVYGHNLGSSEAGHARCAANPRKAVANRSEDSRWQSAASVGVGEKL